MRSKATSSGRSRSLAGAVALLAMLAPLGQTALAQQPSPPLALPAQPDIPSAVAPPVTTTQGLLTLSASAGADQSPIRQGLTWRVFSNDGDRKIVAQSQEASPSFALPPGDYVVHAAYGLASAAKRVTVGGGSVVERVSISAGGLVVNAAIGDVPIPAAKISLSVYIPSAGNSEDKLVTSTLKSGELLLLPEGTYHVDSTYGDSNSVMRADITVKSGKVVTATMLHRAATVVLKLVHQEGGEAMADTGWTVLTPGGDVIREAIGAFPSVTLAEGDYIAIARHDGKVYQGDFKVRSGFDRDIEVVAKETPATTAAR